MSVCSNFSEMSISFRGEEVDINTAMDELFKDIQSCVNDCNGFTRQMLMLGEQDNDFIEASKLHLSCQDSAKIMVGLFKELVAVMLKVRGKIPPELKEEHDMMLSQRQSEMKQ